MTQIVTLDAKPEPIAIDPAKTAVIVVDMQNDFGSKGGCLTELELTFPAFSGPLALQQGSSLRPDAWASKSFI